MRTEYETEWMRLMPQHTNYQISSNSPILLDDKSKTQTASGSVLSAGVLVDSGSPILDVGLNETLDHQEKSKFVSPKGNHILDSAEN